MPLVSLTKTEDISEVAETITYHVWLGSYVKAVWSERPITIYISELNRLLSQPRIMEPIAEYIKALPENAREKLLIDAIGYFLKMNPQICLQVGIPLNL